MIEIKVRQIDRKNAEVKVETIDSISDLGLRDKDELMELAIILSEQLSQLLLEVDKLDS